MPLEIEKNKALLLSTLPYQDHEADRIAKSFYQVFLPELAKINTIDNVENLGDVLFAVGVDGATYRIVISEDRYIWKAERMVENGENVILFR